MTFQLWELSKSFFYHLFKMFTIHIRHYLLTIC